MKRISFLTQRYLAAVERATGLLVGTVVLLSLALIAGLDHATGAELSFAPFYTLPVLLCAWRFGIRRSLAVSALAALVWTLVDAASVREYGSAFVYLWNGGARFLTYALVSLLTVGVRAGLKASVHEADHDHLTQLWNGRRFERELEALEMDSGEARLIVCCDLDGFKAINDRFGHARGDEVLRHFALSLRVSLQKGDIAARLGGDEFAVLLAGGSHGELELRAASLQHVVQATLNELNEGLGCSMGAARVDPERPVREQLQAADAALYRAKRAGKGRLETGRLADLKPIPATAPLPPARPPARQAAAGSRRSA